MVTSPPQAAGSSDLAHFTGGSGIGSMNMDDIMRNIYGDTPPPDAAGRPVEPVLATATDVTAARRTLEEVWKEISAAGGLSGPTARSRRSHRRRRRRRVGYDAGGFPG
jgi:ABA responsive element binding factor